MSGCAVTGVGALTALGEGGATTFERLLEGERAFSEVTLFDVDGYRVGRAATIPAFGGAAEATSRTSAMAIVAGREALRDAGLEGEGARRGARLGLVVGTTTSGMLETEALLAELFAAPRASRVAPPRLLSHPLSAVGEQVAAGLGPFARVRTLSAACASGAYALALGAAWVELGLVDACLCGGADALCRVTLAGFGALGALDPEGARPFDRGRRGLMIGEGAGFVVLESGARARARGAPVRAWLSGYGMASEAHHVTNPEPSGATPARVMRAALARAGLDGDAVGYVNAHGTGTPLNDAMEARAVREALGERGAVVPISSQKGQIGHTLGAAGAVEAVISLLAIERGELPPTGGLETAEVELAHVRRRTRAEVSAALSCSFGFGGMDAALLLTRDAPEARAARPSEVYVGGAAAVTPAGVLSRSALARLDLGADADRVPEGTLAGLDPVRARRLDAASRLAVVAVEAAGLTAGDAALVVGAAFGSVDATAAFVERIRVKGARLASPADFPSLVPSAPAGHVSTYVGTRGPSCVVADMETSGEAAFAHAFELLRAGDAPEACACAVQEQSEIVDGAMARLFDGGSSLPRREGAAALWLSPEREGAWARVARVDVFRDRTVSFPERVHGRCVVLVGRASEDLREALDASAWGAALRVEIAPLDGAHEAVGAIALARASATIGSGAHDAALVVGGSLARGYVVLLERA